MPTYLRKFYLKELLDVKQLEKNEIEKAQNKSKIQKSQSPTKPSITPKFKR